MTTDTAPLPELVAALDLCAEDMAFVCRLHDREPDRALLLHLASEDVRHWFGVGLQGPDATAGMNMLGLFLSGFCASPDRQDHAVEALAADYADLYLTFGKRLAPNESYWLTEDHIERQDPMFDVRRWYRHYGLAAGNWRTRPDDHLVHEMEFVAALLQLGDAPALCDAATFLDRHLLRWSAKFLGGVAQRAATPFYAGLALVTESLLQTVRLLLEEAAGVPRPAIGSDSSPVLNRGADAPFVPGLGPGW